MKARRLLNKKMRFEELEGRLTLSVVPGLPGAAVLPTAPHTNAAAQVAKSNATTAPIANVSANWSGYAIPSSANSVSYVAGTWTVPTASTKTNGYSSFWVGIDGFSSSTVEQIGTDSDVVDGRATYYAWYEMYPSGSVNISSITVNAGDSITASVAYVNSKFVLTIADNTDHQSFTKSFTGTGEARSSAEWIAEAPSSGYGVLPLADFGSAKFTNAYATIGGTTAQIDHWQSYLLNMESGSRTVASTGALSDSQATVPTASSTYTGLVSSFSVAYDGASTSTTTTSGGGAGSTTTPGSGSSTGGSGTGGLTGWAGWAGSGHSWGHGWRQVNIAAHLDSSSDIAARDLFFASSESLSLLKLRM
jgi:hypothetical protein